MSPETIAPALELRWREHMLELGDLALANGAFDPARSEALLTSAYGRAVSVRALPYIERAIATKREGSIALSLTHLALAGLPVLVDPAAPRERAFAALDLMKRGVTPQTIIAALDDDPKGKRAYSPDQPRVPAGNGRVSGQWTSGEGGEGAPTPPTSDETAQPPTHEALVADNSDNWLQYLNPVDDASAAERDGSPFNGAGPNDQHTRAVMESMANFHTMGFIVNPGDREYSVLIQGFSTPRKYDFLAFDPDTGEYVGVEVKSTKYDAIRLNQDQVQKDAAIYEVGGVFLENRGAWLTSVAYDTACDGCENLRIRTQYLHSLLLAAGVKFNTRRYIEESN